MYGPLKITFVGDIVTIKNIGGGLLEGINYYWRVYITIGGSTLLLEGVLLLKGLLLLEG